MYMKYNRTQILLYLNSWVFANNVMFSFGLGYNKSNLPLPSLPFPSPSFPSLPPFPFLSHLHKSQLSALSEPGMVLWRYRTE